MDEAIVELMDLSLIRVNETGTMISVHRLIQLGYLGAQSPRVRHSRSHIASSKRRSLPVDEAIFSIFGRLPVGTAPPPWYGIGEP